MNRQERDDLLKFLAPLLRARATDKDFAAETLILEHCARQPDALYLLVQRAMALESALGAAQARIAQLQAGHEAASGSQAASHATPDAREQVVNPAADPQGAWGRGLLAQIGGVGAIGAAGVGLGLGVAAGVVAGGLLLDALEDGFDGEL